MDSTIAGWTDALDKSVAAAGDHHRECAGAAIGYLGESLVVLVSAEYARLGIAATGLATVASALAKDCVEVAAQTATRRTPAPRSLELVQLTGARLLDTVRDLAGTAPDPDRRVLMSYLVDQLGPALTTLSQLSRGTELKHRLTRMQNDGEQLQDIVGVLNGEFDPAQRTVPRPIALPSATYRNLAGEVRMRLPESLEVLDRAIHELVDRDQDISVAATLAVNITSEFVVRRCESELETLGITEHALAADSWVALQASLAPIHDLATRPPDPAILLAAKNAYSEALTATPSELAQAVQRVPVIASGLQKAMRGWPNESLNSITSRLPGSYGGGMSLDLAKNRVVTFLDAAAAGTVVLATEVGPLNPGAEAPDAFRRVAGMPMFRSGVREAEQFARTYTMPRRERLEGHEPRRRSKTGSSRADPSLPPGYRIAVRKVPESPTSYEVMCGWGRSEEFVGLRSDRPGAERAAWQHHDRRAARQSSTPPGTARITPPDRSGPRP